MLDKLVELDLATVVNVALLKQLVNDSLTVTVFDTFQSQELVKFIFIDAARAIEVDGGELPPQLFKFVRREMHLIVVLGHYLRVIL